MADLEQAPPCRWRERTRQAQDFQVEVEVARVRSGPGGAASRSAAGGPLVEPDDHAADELGGRPFQRDDAVMISSAGRAGGPPFP